MHSSPSGVSARSRALPVALLILASSALWSIGLCLPNAAIGGETDATVAATELPSQTSSIAEAPAVKGERIDQSLLLSYLVDKSAFTLIDARSPAEYETGHVEGALNIPIERVRSDNEELPASLDQPILVYCKTGRRAEAVAQSLKDLGYASVRVLPSEQLLFHDDLIVFNCGQ